jgi:hypothetical protein
MSFGPNAETGDDQVSYFFLCVAILVTVILWVYFTYLLVFWSPIHTNKKQSVDDGVKHDTGTSESKADRRLRRRHDRA